MRLVKFVALSAIMALSLAHVIHADIGVGVSLARISMDEPLVGGGTYRLPSVGVVNTGTEPSDYQVGVGYRSGQKELRVPAEWISFTPSTFHLEAGGVQQVAVTLQVPMKANPGDYFGFIEAQSSARGGGVPIAVAAATKLYFSIRPSNVFVAIWAKVSGFVTATAPASYICLGVLAFVAIVFLFRKFFRIRFRLERKR